jgi:hypothetical protein
LRARVVHAFGGTGRYVGMVNNLRLSASFLGASLHVAKIALNVCIMRVHFHFC